MFADMREVNLKKKTRGLMMSIKLERFKTQAIGTSTNQCKACSSILPWPFNWILFVNGIWSNSSTFRTS